MELKEVNKEARKIIRKCGGQVPRFTKEEKETGSKLWIDETGEYWCSQPGHPQGERFSFSEFRQPENLQFEMMEAAKVVFGE